MFRIVLVFCVLLGGLGTPRSAQAQRGELIGDLFRTIAEAQREREERKRVEAEHRAKHSPVVVPPKTNHPIHPIRKGRPGAHPRRHGDPRLASFQKSSLATSQQLDHLISQLNLSVSRVTGLRPLIGDAWHLKAELDLLNKQGAIAQHCDQVQDGYCRLDSEWRTLSYNLRAMPDLPDSIRTHVLALDQSCNSQCKLLGIQPQLDRQRLLQQMVAASTYTSALLHDLRSPELRSPQTRKLLGSVRRLRENLRHQVEGIRGAQYDEILSLFSDYADQWQRFTPKLYALENPTVDRRVREVSRCVRNIYGLLWMPASLDRQYLHHVAHRMQDQLNSTLDRISVRTLVQLPPAEQSAILNAAAELAGQCDQFCNGLESQQTLQAIQNHYQPLERRLNYLVGMLDHPSLADQRFATTGITDSCNELRQMLSIPVGLDRSRALELAASLEGLADQLNVNVVRYKRYLTSRRFQKSTIRTNDRFRTQVLALYAQLRDKQDLDILQATCQKMLVQWQQLTEIIKAMPENGLSGRRYHRIEGTYEQLAPVVAELAVMLAR